MPTQALTVGELDEKALLARIFPRLGAPAALLGPGDDAAVVAAPDGRSVISIDTLVQDQDFRLHWPCGYRTSGFDVGFKCAAQNLSDINAMGAEATSLVVSLTLPPVTPVAWVEDLADGLQEALRSLGAGRCSVVGGDLGSGREIVVTAAVGGDLGGRQPLLRSGARPGDVLALAGNAGCAAAGLAVLESGLHYDVLAAGTGPGDRELVELIRLQCRPRPPLDLGPLASQYGATAMLDVSDGLVRDAGRMARASGVDIDLDLGWVQGRAAALSAAASRVDADPVAWVLGGGEDHSLLAAFGPQAQLPEGFERIGSIAGGTGAVTVGGQAPRAVGWDHFAR